MNPKPEYVRARTWEEMTPAEREAYDPQHRVRLPECDYEYDPLAAYDCETYARDDE
jgi:hypothetical protein